MVKVAARKLRPWEGSKLQCMKRQLVNTVNNPATHLVEVRAWEAGK